MKPDHDPILDRLSTLERVDLPAGVADRQHRLLARAFREHSALPPIASRVLAAWDAYLEPGLVAGAGAAYVVWAFRAAADLVSKG